MTPIEDKDFELNIDTAKEVWKLKGKLENFMENTNSSLEEIKDSIKGIYRKIDTQEDQLRSLVETRVSREFCDERHKSFEKIVNNARPKTRRDYFISSLKWSGIFTLLTALASVLSALIRKYMHIF